MTAPLQRQRCGGDWFRRAGEVEGAPDYQPALSFLEAQKNALTPRI